MENNIDFYFAPVFIPTLCRSTHFIRLIESLKRNTWAKYTDVYIGLDYPPSEKYRKGWQEICDYLEQGDFSAFANLVVVKHPKNLGAWENEAVMTDYILKRYECLILTDDDMEFSPNFLEYMDKCLWKYRDDKDVLFVSGYCYPLNWKVEEGATCFRQNFHVPAWGLGEWAKKHAIYSDYNKNGRLLKDADQFVKAGRDKQMSLASFRYYFSEALSFKGRTGFFDTNTDVSLSAYLPCKGGYCIFPTISKARNHGWDGSGVCCHTIVDDFGNHCGNYDYSHQPIDQSDTFELVADDSLKYLEDNRLAISEFEDDPNPGSKLLLEAAKHRYQLIKKYGRRVAVLVHLLEFLWSKITRHNK